MGALERGRERGGERENQADNLGVEDIHAMKRVIQPLHQMSHVMLQNVEESAKLLREITEKKTERHTSTTNNPSTHQHINTSTHQHINTSTHQHSSKRKKETKQDLCAQVGDDASLR
jgi:hypothetical protein